MNAENLISDTIIPLRTSDTGEEALGIMSDLYLRHLPIVNQTQLLGLLSEDDILNNDVEEAVGSYRLSLTHPYVHAKDHVYDVMRLLAQYQLTVVPVVDDKENYIGLITLEDLMRYFAESGPFQETGGIIVLEMARQDYSLSEIARIVESESAIILSLIVETFPDSALMDVTIKTNRQHISPVISAFERYNYSVKASFNEVEYYDTLRERYDALMSYLNV